MSRSIGNSPNTKTIFVGHEHNQLAGRDTIINIYFILYNKKIEFKNFYQVHYKQIFSVTIIKNTKRYSTQVFYHKNMCLPNHESLHTFMTDARDKFNLAVQDDPDHLTQPVINAKNEWHKFTVQIMTLLTDKKSGIPTELRQTLYAELCDWHVAMGNTILYRNTSVQVDQLLRRVAVKI